MSHSFPSSQSFHSFYQNVFQDRWPLIFEALKTKETQIVLNNIFAQTSSEEFSFIADETSMKSHSPIPRGANGLLAYYILDPSSFYVGKALEVKQGEKVLDMCAAPGGKTLVLAMDMFRSYQNIENETLNNSLETTLSSASSLNLELSSDSDSDLSSSSSSDLGVLFANEYSSTRRERLTKVIQQYLPKTLRQKSVWVFGKDGGKFALTHKEYFDKILIDAPCSGERHFVQKSQGKNFEAKLNLWSESQSKKLSDRQYALLTGAFLALKKGGRLVYSTCSLSPYENDGTIRKFIQKKQKKLSFEVEKFPKEKTPQGAEETEFGYIFLPDQCGYGPLFFSSIKKSC